MIFNESPLSGAFVIDIEPFEDSRGFFARTSCEADFKAHGLQWEFRQCSLSYSERAGTLRGLHFQRPPHGEDKLVRCARGRVYDVFVDLRADSPTFKRWYGVELSADNRRAVYVPRGFAHGFVTLVDECDVYYQITTPYHPESVDGFRWDDRSFGIEWPMAPRVVSDRDLKARPFCESDGLYL